MDTIGDFLTVIRNASAAKKATCSVAFSNMRKSLANLLKSEGYVADVQEETNDRGLKSLIIRLKYVKGVPAVSVLKRCSTPGARWYVNKENIPQVINGLGICILSTSKGIVTGKQAKEMGIGGELICKIW